MAFSKRYPKHVEGSSYPKWVEVALSDAEEREVEAKARTENIRIFKECVIDAKQIVEESKLAEKDIVNIARELFDKRASHVVYLKESKTKEKFDST